MVESYMKQSGVRESDEKANDNAEEKARAEKAPKASVEKELRVEEKSLEKTKVAEALKKSAETASKEPKKVGETVEKPAGEKKVEKKEEKKAEEKKPEEKREIVLQRVFTVPLADAYSKPAKKRAGRAVKLLREFLSKHMKAEMQSVKIDPPVNEFIESRGATSPAKAVRVDASKDKKGIVVAKLAAA